MKEETLLSFLKDEHNKCSLALINEDLKQVRKRLITCIDLIDQIKKLEELRKGDE
jgi:hypothetical protein